MSGTGSSSIYLYNNLPFSHQNIGNKLEKEKEDYHADSRFNLEKTDKVGQSRTKSDKAGQSRTKSDKVGQSRTIRTFIGAPRSAVWRRKKNCFKGSDRKCLPTFLLLPPMPMVVVDGGCAAAADS
jgi:hypothetical protein